MIFLGPEQTAMDLALQAVSGGAAVLGVLMEAPLVTTERPHSRDEACGCCWVSFVSLLLCHAQGAAFPTCL